MHRCATAIDSDVPRGLMTHERCAHRAQRPRTLIKPGKVRVLALRRVDGLCVQTVTTSPSRAHSNPASF